MQTSNQHGFDSRQNKAMLVEVLARAGVIKNDTPQQEIINAVDSSIINVLQIHPSGGDLISLNKLALKMIKEKLSQSPPVIQTPKQNIVERQPYTAKEIAEQRKNHFNTELEQRQEEFNTFMKRETPQGLTFSDEMDKPIGAEMDSLIEKAVASRNIDMEANQVKLKDINEQHPNLQQQAQVNGNIEKRLESIESLLQKIWNKLNPES